MNKETRDMFTAIFDSYDSKQPNSINLKEVRTRFGGVVKENLSFEKDKVENMPKALRDGDYVPFVANLEF
ncbi:MAG: hypothetical protein AAF673_06130, partial [Pseudomonadota bacterium]